MMTREWPSGAYEIAMMIRKVIREQTNEEQSTHDAAEIIAFADHNNDMVRAQVAISLVRIHHRTPLAKETLLKLLQDNEKIVRLAAQAAYPTVFRNPPST